MAMCRHSSMTPRKWAIKPRIGELPGSRSRARITARRRPRKARRAKELHAQHAIEATAKLRQNWSGVALRSRGGSLASNSARFSVGCGIAGGAAGLAGGGAVSDADFVDSSG